MSTMINREICNCQGDRRYTQYLEVEYAPLPDGMHTGFSAGICEGCKNITGFPAANLRMFINQGSAFDINEFYNNLEVSIHRDSSERLAMDMRYKKYKSKLFKDRISKSILPTLVPFLLGCIIAYLLTRS